MTNQETGGAAQSRVEFNHKLVFLTLTGDTLEVTGKRLDLRVEADTAFCMLVLEVQYHVYVQMLAGEWMGLLAEARGHDSEMVFEKQQPVELVARLRQSLMNRALHEGSEAEQVLKVLLQDRAEDGNSLLLSESWLITEIKQQVVLPEELEGSLKKGYRTLWGELPGSLSSQSAAQPGVSALVMKEVVEACFTTLELDCEWVDDTIARVSFIGEQGTWTVLVRIDEGKQLCIVYSIYPVMVPKEHRTKLALFLIEENYDLAVGSFEMDTADGELRYRTSMDVEKDRLTTGLFGQLFMTNVVVMDQYFQAIAEGIQ